MEEITKRAHAKLIKKSLWQYFIAKELKSPILHQESILRDLQHAQIKVNIKTVDMRFYRDWAVGSCHSGLSDSTVSNMLDTVLTLTVYNEFL